MKKAHVILTKMIFKDHDKKINNNDNKNKSIFFWCSLVAGAALVPNEGRKVYVSCLSSLV
jgi:hypothetical protein